MHASVKALLLTSSVYSACSEVSLQQQQAQLQSTTLLLYNSCVQYPQLMLMQLQATTLHASTSCNICAATTYDSACMYSIATALQRAEQKSVATGGLSYN
jgi:hypothetical protein